MNRFVHCLLVFALAFSAVAVSAHGTAHSDSGLEQCLLCATHAGASPAAAGAPPSFPVVAEQRIPPERPEVFVLPGRLISLPEPRAPPAQS